MRRYWSALRRGVTAVLLLPLAAVAQEGTITGVVVDVEDQDQKPMTNVPVFVSANGIIQQIGRTNEEGTTGPLTLQTPATGRVRVVVEECDEEKRRRIVMRLDDAQPEDDCDEIAAAFFPSQRRTHVRVRVTPGRTTIETSTTTLAGDRTPRVGFEAEAGIGYARFGKFGQTVGDQPRLNSYSADNSYLTPVVGVRVTFGNRVCAGARLTFGSLQYRQAYELNGGSAPSFVNGDVTGYFVDTHGCYRIPFRTFVLQFSAGPTLAFNALDLRADWGDGVESTSRSESGWKFNYGAAVERRVSDRFAVRAQYGGITAFKDQDADEQNLFAVLLVVLLGSRSNPF